MSKLSFWDLRKANISRQSNAFTGCKSWTPTDWATAMAGECGEACNLIKKLRRLTGFDTNSIHYVSDEIEVIEQIADELADTIIYIDLLANRLGIDLSKAVMQKFNKTSSKMKSPTRLGKGKNNP